MFTSAIWQVKKGMEQKFINEWKAFSDWTRANRKGTMFAYLLRDTSDPSRFMAFGEWESKQDVQAWRGSPEFAAYMKKFDSLCESREMFSLEALVRIGEPQTVS